MCLFFSINVLVYLFAALILISAFICILIVSGCIGFLSDDFGFHYDWLLAIGHKHFLSRCDGRKIIFSILSMHLMNTVVLQEVSENKYLMH